MNRRTVHGASTNGGQLHFIAEKYLVSHSTRAMSGLPVCACTNYMLIGVTVGLVTCIATGLIISIKDKPIDPGVLALITTVAGALLKMFSDAFAFEFGSSRGSKEKDAQVTEFKNALLCIGESQGEAAKELDLWTGIR